MRPLLRRLSACALLALACPAAAQDGAVPPQIGLMGTIPLYWGESGDIGELLAGTGESHWARPLLERHGPLVPLDRIDAAALAGLDRLILAQPRALAPDENVALDAWVRSGGSVLLFADPMLTGESRFGIGDRRRPQDVILLSPILRHWGLELRFDEAQPEGIQTREFAGTVLPVNLAGHFERLPSSPDCAVEAAGIVAFCRIGQGHVALVADAAMLDLHHPHPAAAGALEVLFSRVFPQAAGRARDVPGEGETQGSSAIYLPKGSSGEPPG